ncbi:MAG: zinc ribbon domain-containing protein [Chloroflexi bacterium]|nr:zinc ribbon domain-containing protein [Chloroflexota bacterium]
MPTYDFVCKGCRHVFEVFRSIKETGPAKCPKCSGKNTMQLFFNSPTVFSRNIDHPDSPLDDMPNADKMRKTADMAIHKAMKDMGMS